MAQRNNRKQPVYSADTLALRYIGGLVLVALGVMMFLATGLGMPGNVFEALRQVCFGLTGGLALILPALPIWAGVLVIWSSQRKAPVKPFVFAFLAFLSLCAFVVLVTRIGQEEYLGLLARTSDGSWGGVIYRGYFQSIQLKASGGALGVILAFPFWSLVGQILGAVITFLLTALCVLLALNLTPSRIRDLATGKVSLRLRRSREDRAAQDQQQIAFQQEQERQRQMAYEQQAYILQQQQQARAAAQQAQAAGRQASGKWSQPAAEPWPQGAGVPEWAETNYQTGQQQAWPGAGPAGTDSVREWQQQATDRRAAISAGRESKIFSPQAGSQNTGKSRIFDAPQEQEKPRASRIFGKKKNEEDGLSELSPEEKRKEGMAYPVSGRVKAQPAAGTAEEPEAGRQIAEPAEKKPSEAPAKPIRKTDRIRAEQEQIEEDLDRWRRPAEDRAEEQETEALPWNGNSFRSEPEETDVREAEDPRKQPARKPDRESREAKTGKPEAIPVPVAHDTIADPTWKPELKHVDVKEKQEEEYWEPTPYYAPPITDLKKPDISVLDTTREDEERSRKLEATLASFKVQARVVHVTHGPVVSRFELELAPGTKVGKVAELERDILSGMAATSVRIEAPIPGKSLVGVEVPNPQRATVTLREVLESPPMQNAKSILTVALGKDIAGAPIVCDLAKMPHMLIAGATGSGKSVCINTIINSLLFRAGPDEVKMILVDPKVVELQCYNGIPHLLLPVVNDPHKASAALAWAVAEMMERYDKFSERGVRNLEGYNNVLGPGEKPMPRIVIIIDELADLMMVCKKDVEEYICRLTQLARAAGIHLIVATQRPSVDVITGLIKANIPSRIAFKTASYVDSRTILDRNGSEQLLGWGDMLYLPTGSFTPTRIQGCFLSDEEVNRIADHVRQANPSAYDPDVLDKLEQLTKGQEDGPGMDMIGGTPENSSGDTDLFEQAVEFAIADGQISTSTLQRRLKVGYARAGRLTDEMEERGIVSAKDGSKPRKCLITREQWEAMRESAQGAVAEGKSS